MVIKRYDTEKEAKEDRHEVGDVWRVEHSFISSKKWFVKFPTCIDAFRTKQTALAYASMIPSRYKIN